jgi:hypothetical protein
MTPDIPAIAFDIRRILGVGKGHEWLGSIFSINCIAVGDKRARGSVVVEVLCYKLDGREFETR